MDYSLKQYFLLFSFEIFFFPLQKTSSSKGQWLKAKVISFFTGQEINKISFKKLLFFNWTGFALPFS